MSQKEAVGRICFTSETSILNSHPSPNLFQAHYMQYTVLGFLVKINKGNNLERNLFSCAIALSVAKDSITTVLYSAAINKGKARKRGVTDHSLTFLKEVLCVKKLS